MSISPDLDQIITMLREQWPFLAAKYHVRSIGVFGSYVRHEEKPGSDIDLLISFEETPGLLKFIELENRLSDLLGGKVDLVMEKSLKPNIARRVLPEVVHL
ncbi:MAG: nucleotidyltransferase family protein [Acidobacteria bacterium]|nr:nucleotidyltransferase family protein [Acidobacteriota bacterium]